MSLKYEKLIRKMTLAEKAVMMSGKNTWETVDFEKYGIPSMAMSDGPHGLRRQAGAGDHLGLNASLPATCFPTAAGVANSWDEALGEEIGEALAEEAVTMGVNVILGPGLNIKRSPLCGRNFEYFSEDPYHAGKMAAAYVRGIQSKGIAACPKHFAANSQELRRMANDSVVDERTFREIYTTGFEIAIKEGKSKSIMSSCQGKPNLNVLFNYNMPIRGYAKMTGGIVTMKMAEALTEMANGHRIKGTAHLIKAAINRG